MSSIGIIFRSYAKESSLVDRIFNRAVQSCYRAVDLINASTNKRFFEKVMVAIPVDYDCGKLFNQLTKYLKQYKEIEIKEFTGHHSSAVLNKAVEDIGTDYVMIVSHKASEFLTEELMFDIFIAIGKKAKAGGLVLPEMEDIILSGRIQNTFSFWNRNELLRVGGFKSENGVEEIRPLVEIIQKHGKSIAILNPKNPNNIGLDINPSDEGERRHKEVMTTKVPMHIHELEELGVNFEFIRRGILSGYPRYC